MCRSEINQLMHVCRGLRDSGSAPSPISGRVQRWQTRWPDSQDSGSSFPRLVGLTSSRSMRHSLQWGLMHQGRGESLPSAVMPDGASPEPGSCQGGPVWWCVGGKPSSSSPSIPARLLHIDVRVGEVSSRGWMQTWSSGPDLAIRPSLCPCPGHLPGWHHHGE